MSSYFSVESQEEEERIKQEMSTITVSNKETCPSLNTMQPRLITAAEVLEERKALRQELGYIPHGTGRGWSSYFWVSCDCPNCRDNYDPTGEESAKYLNMDHESFFRGQSEQPSFAFSRCAKESFLAHVTPGFYVGKRRDCLTIEQVSEIAIQAPLILHIGTDGTWDEFLPSSDETTWTRRTYTKGRSVFYKQGENPPIPSGELVQRLREFYCRD